MRSALALALVALVGWGTAVAQTPPVVGTTPSGCASSQTNCQTSIPRSNILTWLPGLYTDASSSTNFTNGSGGHANLFAYEMPDDVVAVALILGNGLSTPWSLTEAVATSSSMWGSGTAGLTPYDNNGNISSTFLPFTFANNGQASMPWPGSSSSYTSASNAGRILLGLNTSAATTTGGTTLTFSNTAPSWLTGYAPAAGMYAFDGLGCIPTGDKVVSVTGTTVVLASGVTAGAGGSGCQSGQWIAFSWGPPGPLGIQVPSATNPGVPNLIVSDWLPMVSYYRLDSVQAAQTVTAANGAIPANTTILSVTPAGITISNPTTAAIASQKITATTTVMTTVDNPAGAISVTLPSTAGFQSGQLISSSAGNLANSYLYGVQASTNQLLIATGGISADMPAGSTVTGTNYFYSSSTSVPAGSTFIPANGSISPRPILMIRLFTGNTTVWSRTYPYGNTPFVESNNYGMPGMTTFEGPQSGGSAVDVVNFPGNSTTGATAADSPVWGLMFLTKHNGIECMANGDSHVEGTTTSSNWANAFRRACYAMATPGTPVEVANAAHYGWTEQQYQPLGAALLQLVRPGAFFMPAGTSNGSGSPQDMVNGLVSLRGYANTIGTKTIVSLDFPTNSKYVLTAALASAVTNSTAGTMNIYVPSGSGGAGLAVTCSGCSVGLTATIAADSNAISFSSPQTLAAGTPLQFNVLGATTTSGSTTVTLATPAPISSSFLVSGANFPSGASLSVTQGSTSATLSSPASASGSTTALLYEVFAQEFTRSRWNGQSLDQIGTTSTVTLVDPNNVVTDYTVAPPQLKAGVTWDGIHLHDGGMTLFENKILLPTLLQMRGN